MRITFQYQALRYQNNINTALNTMLTAGEKVNKKSGVLNPETSPSRYIASYNLQRIIDDNTQFKTNSESAAGWLTEAERVIKQAYEQVSKVRDELAVYGANGTNSLESMKALAGDVKEIYSQLFDLANTQYMGRYIFSGFQTNTMPFAKSDSLISSVSEMYGNGGQVSTRSVYTDLRELSSGTYTVQVDVKGDTGYLRLYDKNGKIVTIDSTGSDESAKNGNNLTTEMTFKLEPGAIINTGRGVSITLPNDIATAKTGLKYQFTYKAGSNASYYGDNGQINNQIGFNQTVGINFTGEQLFMQNNKILKSSQFNSVNGVALTASSLFSQIDKANSSKSDSITIKGTDHQGFSVGTAKVLGTEGVTLNMLNATKEERTLTFGYAGKFYQIEIPAKGYASVGELTETINYQLSKAQYVGSQDVVGNYPTADAMAFDINSQVSDINNANLTKDSRYQVDLSKQISVSADGSRLQFITSDTGNHTILSVTGSKHNSLGFDDNTILSVGKDTVFEIGYDFKENGINTLYTTHNAINLSSTATFKVNGKVVQVEGLSSATTQREKEMLIDQAVQRAGFGYGVTAHLDATGNPDEYNVTFTMQNMNYDRNTRLSTTYLNSTLPVTTDNQTATMEKNITVDIKEKTISDYMTFIKELYGQTVDVRLEDGRIAVEDLRSGQSRLTMNMVENNEGISLPVVDQFAVVGGKYTGICDDLWTVNMNMAHNADGTNDVSISVINSKGLEIVNNTINNYQGGKIQLPNGVYVVPDSNMTTSVFHLNLTGPASLNFGDMNIVQDGENANMFTSLMNLYNALNNEINSAEKGVPSMWNDSTMKSTAIPYFDGVFGGNSNANWRYEIEPTNGTSEFYLQNMFTQSSGKINFNPALGATNLDFSVQLYDNSTKTFKEELISIPLAGITSSSDLSNAIASTINKNTNLYNNNVRAYVENGQVMFESGSGSRSISIKPASDKDLYMMGVNQQTGTALKTTFSANATMDFHYYDGATWQTATATIPAGTYTDTADVLANITGLPAGINATVANDVLTFNSPTNVPFYYDNVVNPGGALGLNNTTLNYTTGNKVVPLDLSQATDAQRTLTFTYSTNGLDNKNISITMDKNTYNTTDDMVAAINDKLAAAGISTLYTAVKSGDSIAFKTDASVVRSVVEGDYEGYLGFAKIGDKVNIKVVDEQGKSVQNISADTANKEYSVSDGLLLGFDKGSLYATDYFTGTVGSGVKYEIGVLDSVQSQLLQCLTQVGNRSLRVESVMNFTSTIVTNYESQKSTYLQATDTDQIKLSTDYTLAKQAYEYALSIVSTSMKISILDYLR